MDFFGGLVLSEYTDGARDDITMTSSDTLVIPTKSQLRQELLDHAREGKRSGSVQPWREAA
jgi:hypothetical protein